MRYIYDKSKNERLKEERGVSFEQIITVLESDQVLSVAKHHNQEKYPEQSYIELEINRYVWRVPCKFTNEGLVLKTAYPSRKSTKKAKKGQT